MRAVLVATTIALSGGSAIAQTPPPPEAATIDHVALRVADLGRSRAFYASLFHLREVPAPVRGAHWFDLGRGVQLHLFVGLTEPVRINRGTHLALRVPDLAQFQAELDRRGIAWQDFEGRPSTVNRVRTDGVRQIFLQDPDGYWIEVNNTGR